MKLEAGCPHCKGIILIDTDILEHKEPPAEVSNVIPIRPGDYRELQMHVKTFGFEESKKRLLNMNYHPAFLAGIFKKIMKRNEW